MGDLISRQAAIDAVRVMQTYKLSEGDDMLLVDQAEVMTELTMLPSAEPEIIRCRDCKWKYNHICTRAVELFIDNNDFCSWAERR